MASVWYLVVGGGGPGGYADGSGNAYAGAGGGGGGFRTNAAYDHVVTVQAYAITVGAGGLTANPSANNGGNSVFDTITALGGGYGALGPKTPFPASAGANGGSGGGSANGGTAGNGTAGQGNNGGSGGVATGASAGGGGATSVGQPEVPADNDGGAGGAGTASTITGASVTYAGGGGGGGYGGATGAGGAGGAGGGGNGGTGLRTVGANGSANTGGGGGGGGGNSSGGPTAGGNGGSGVVIIRYATADLTATGGTITTDGSHTVHTFTGDGTFDVTAISAPPVAAFSGTPLTGAAPLSVAFTDQSTNTPTSWSWDFGDGQTSTQQNPTNIYAAAGTYTVTLTATNSAGSDAEVKNAYITVTAPATAETPAAKPSGGRPAYSGYETRTRTKEEIRKEREDYGILPRAVEVIEAVATRQAADYRQDEQQRLEELTRELELQSVEFEARYLELLNERRAALIVEETARLLKRKLREDEEMLLLMMASVV